MDDKQLYELAHRVQLIAFELAPKHGLSIQAAVEDNLNPRACQTKTGLFLVYYFGVPMFIRTPWGEWICWRVSGGYRYTPLPQVCNSDLTLRSGSSLIILMPEFLTALSATESQPVRDTLLGQDGPVFALCCVGDIELPKAVERDRDNFLKSEEAHRQWDSFQ